MKWGCWQNNRYRLYYRCSFLGEMEKQLAGKYLTELILGDKGWCITKPLCKSSLECKSRAPLIFSVLMEETTNGLNQGPCPGVWFMRSEERTEKKSGLLLPLLVIFSTWAESLKLTHLLVDLNGAYDTGRNRISSLPPLPDTHTPKPLESLKDMSFVWYGWLWAGGSWIASEWQGGLPGEPTSWLEGWPIGHNFLERLS